MHVYFSLILWKWKNKSEKKIISIVNRSFVINKFLSLTVNLSQYAGMHWFILGKKSLFLSSWIKTNIFLVFFSIAVIPVILCITLDLSPGWVLSIKPPIKIYQGLFKPIYMYFLMGLPITMTGFFQVLYIKKISTLFGHLSQSQTPHFQFQRF